MRVSRISPGYSCLIARLAQNGRIRTPVQQNPGQRDLKPGYPVHARSKRIDVYAVAASQERPVNVEKIGILGVQENPGSIAMRASLVV